MVPRLEIISCFIVRALFKRTSTHSALNQDFIDAGHGSQVRNLDNTEVDGYDEGVLKLSVVLRVSHLRSYLADGR